MVLEPDCGFPVDTVNGGCDLVPPAFTTVTCGDSICGSLGFMEAGPDRDWFDLGALAAGTQVTWATTCDVEREMFIVVDDGACGGQEVAARKTASPGGQELVYCLESDTVRVLVGVVGASSVPWSEPDPCYGISCSQYQASVECEACAPPRCPCPGDLDDDCRTCEADLGMLLSRWGCCDNEPCWDAVAARANLDPGAVIMPKLCGDARQHQAISGSDLGVLLADYGCGDCP
jgi:hypothetical protein